MRLTLRRQQILNNDTTIGELLIDGEWFCWTLEDRVRAQKIKHETAIPAGEYIVEINLSARFKERMPLLLNVPQFSGIRIHPGNDHADTSGCILVGFSRTGSRIAQSRAAFDELMHRMEATYPNELISIEIVQPADWPRWDERVTVDLRPAPPPVAIAAPSADAPAAPAMTGPLAAPQTQPAPTVPHGGPAPAAPALVVIAGGTPDDLPRTVTRDGGRAWVTTLVSWITGISASVAGWLQGNFKLVACVVAALCLVTIVYLVRSLVLDYLRMRYAADPGKYNVS
jgi:hypothetical protein